MKYVLASKSPRRREILENLGLQFTTVTAEVDEQSEELDPFRLVEELSLRKGAAVRQLLLERGEDLTDTVIISSDTVVAIDGEILGKPQNEADAHRMLSLLSGRSHSVISGVALLLADREAVSHEVTSVTFESLDDETIAHYLAASHPYDKAGAYAIQGTASLFIRGIEGCYFNVVGLPVHRLNLLHRKLFGKNLLDL